MTPDFFDSIEQDLCDAVRRHAHVRAWRRVWPHRSRALIATVALLVLATPAVAAVSGLFSTGAPDRFGHVTAGDSIGHVIPHDGELLALRVPDPDGGLPWGLRQVRTTRGYACVQLGRIQDGQIGSLGIDHYWDDDHHFHPILPDNYLDADCGVTDPAGNGFLAENTNVERSAGTTYGASGPAAAMCRPAGSGVPRRTPTGQIQPLCPPGSQRLVYLGLLGPDATAITYTTPTGMSATEHTAGNDGAYLLVFRKDRESCQRYNPAGARPVLGGVELIGGGGCGDGETSSQDGVTLPSPITAIHYRNGTVCRLHALDDFDRAYARLFADERLAAMKLFGPPARRHDTIDAAQRERLEALQRRLEARYLKGYPKPGTTAFAADVNPTCPWVGLVEPETRHVTEAHVRAPVSLTVFSGGPYCAIRESNEWDTLAPCGAQTHGRPVKLGRGRFALIDFSFTARQGVHTARSWYEFALTAPNPRGGCSEQDSTSGASFWDIRAGERETWQDWEPVDRPGIVCGVISYQPNGRLSDPESEGGGTPGRDGSLIVGRFSFRVP